MAYSGSRCEDKDSDDDPVHDLYACQMYAELREAPFLSFSNITHKCYISYHCDDGEVIDEEGWMVYNPSSIEFFCFVFKAACLALVTTIRLIQKFKITLLAK